MATLETALASGAVQVLSVDNADFSWMTSREVAQSAVRLSDSIRSMESWISKNIEHAEAAFAAGNLDLAASYDRTVDDAQSRLDVMRTSMLQHANAI
jgi:hypothetical protein